MREIGPLAVVAAMPHGGGISTASLPTQVARIEVRATTNMDADPVRYRGSVWDHHSPAGFREIQYSGVGYLDPLG